MHEFLDHQRRGGLPELTGQHLVDGRIGLCQRCRDHHALATCQTIGFQHIGCLHFAQECLGEPGLGKFSIGRRRHAIGDHPALGEGLGAFQLRRRLAGPEHVEPARPQQVRQAQCQRRFRPDHNQIRLDLQRQLFQPVNVGRRDVKARANLVHAGIARRRMHHVDQRRLGHFPGKSVFPPARSDKKNIHGGLDARRCV